MNQPPASLPLRWWQRGVVYQIYPRSFMDSNNDGIGDLPGILDRLDYLNDGAPASSEAPASLGVDAIWISPFYPSPMKDFGYDVADYCAVHPIFGDLAAFDRLVQAAHGRGLKVIIDWVPNHTSDEHPWFIESRRSRLNPKRDWYIWRDPAPGGGPPNNWGSVFGGPAWTFDPATGQYYLHQFLRGQPDLNWRNPAVEAAMLDTLRFWLGRGVDGFRMDVIGMILKHPGLPDNPPNPAASPNLPADDLFGRQLHPYNEDQDDVHPLLRRIRSVLDEYGDTCAIGEIWFPLPRWVKYYDSLQLPFNFRLIDLPEWSAGRVRASVDELEAALPPGAWPNYVLGNHDRNRLASRIGPAQARVAAMLLLTLRGTPTLYYGDELGMPNVTIPPERMQDPPGLQLGPAYSRDPARTPMQWDGGPGAGFSQAEPWLPLAPDYAARNVAALSADPASILNLYRRLLGLRRASPGLYGGSYTPLDGIPEGCYVYRRDGGGESWLVALNFTGQPQRLSLLGLAGEMSLSTYLDRSGRFAGSLVLRPDEGLLVKLEG